MIGKCLHSEDSNSIVYVPSQGSICHIKNDRIVGVLDHNTFTSCIKCATKFWYPRCKISELSGCLNARWHIELMPVLNNQMTE